MSNGSYTSYELADLGRTIQDTLKASKQKQVIAGLETEQEAENLLSQMISDVEGVEEKAQTTLDTERPKHFWEKLITNPIVNFAVSAINPLAGAALKGVATTTTGIKTQKFEEKKLNKLLADLGLDEKYKGTALWEKYKAGISGMKTGVKDLLAEVSDISQMDIMKKSIPGAIASYSLGKISGDVISGLKESGLADKALEFLPDDALEKGFITADGALTPSGTGYLSELSAAPGTASNWSEFIESLPADFSETELLKLAMQDRDFLSTIMESITPKASITDPRLDADKEQQKGVIKWIQGLLSQ